MRWEQDTMGVVEIPKSAYFGPQTMRAVHNFPISGRPIPNELIHAIGLVKWGAAKTHLELALLTTGRAPLSEETANALIAAAWEVYEGKWDAEFPIDVFQTGSGTSSNMNANEVIANRASEMLGFPLDSLTKPIHPNDHVNMGQSTNDTFPTAIHIALARSISQGLIPTLQKAADVLQEKAESWSNILKIGRTHLVDATPLTLGQEMSGLTRQLRLAQERAKMSLESIMELPIGGTAVGTGINTHPAFAAKVVEKMAVQTQLPFREAENHFEANAQRDGIVTTHSLLKSVAVTLLNIANNIRFLSSGPRCGIQEIILPDLQPGSSIMPGKVNPVLCESLMQVAAKVIGNDTTVSLAGSVGGQFQLNIMMPLLADVALESVRLLIHAVSLFTQKCLQEMQPNEEQCRLSVEKSLAIATGLNPILGYEKAAAIAKEAYYAGKTVRDLCLEKNILPVEELETALDPWKMV